MDDFVVIYLDDILIFSKNSSEHEHHVCLVLKKLQECGLYAKLEKCLFHQSLVEFLGYIILDKGISMDGKKIQLFMSGLLQLQSIMFSIFLILQIFIESLLKIIQRLQHHCLDLQGNKSLYVMKELRMHLKH